MPTQHCCNSASPALHPARRAFKLASWIIPGVTLALMPKCPVCIAAYIALFTGIGISIPVAASLRTALIIACMVSLSFLAFRAIARLLNRSR